MHKIGIKKIKIIGLFLILFVYMLTSDIYNLNEG